MLGRFCVLSLVIASLMTAIYPWRLIAGVKSFIRQQPKVKPFNLLDESTYFVVPTVNEEQIFICQFGYGLLFYLIF